MNKYPYYNFHLYDEKWKLLTSDYYDIIPDKYLISESGKIFNLVTGNIMKQETIPNNKGNVYARIRLCANNKNGYVKVLVHRLVALYYLDENDDPHNKRFVDHLDGHKLHNHYTNLEWVTPVENAIRSYKMGLSKTVGSRHPLAKYTDEQIHSMCELLQMGFDNLSIACMLYSDDESLKSLDELKSDTEFNRLYVYIKKLRSRTFRKDIVLQYDF